MKILVCISCVPDTTSRINFIDNNTKFDTNGVQFIIGPYDDYALARAVEIKEANAATTLTVLNVGLAETEPIIRKALGMCADDSIRLSADIADAVFVFAQIAQHESGFDLVVKGREPIDLNRGVVH